MINNDQATQFYNLIENAQTVLVIFQDQDFDTAAAAASLYQGLQQLGKSVTLASPSKSRFSNQITALEQARTEIGNQYLSISFEYSETAVDKVSYHIGEETGRFYLTIKPKPGEQPLDSSSVDFSYTGVSADVLVLIGVQRVEDLNQLYSGYEDTYENTSTIAINAQSVNQSGLSISPDVSTSQTVAELLHSAHVTVSEESATYLIQGIENATRNFSSPDVAPETFEMVAHLMRQGGKRTQTQPKSMQSPPSQNQPRSNQPREVQPEQEKPAHKPKQKQVGGLDHRPSESAPKGG